MTVLARDVSNYTVELTDDMVQQWQAEGVGLLIIQAFPPEYTDKYAEQQRQIAACERNGMPYDAYVYDYLSDPTWLWGALEGLSNNHPRKVWLDEEDVETDQGMDPPYRAYIISARTQNVIDRGYVCGIYTGAWWWVPKVGTNWDLAAFPLWAAQYDGVPDTTVFTPFGGWTKCAIKQYAGSQPDGTDLDVLSEEEAAELAGCDTYKQAIERAVNRLQIELDRKNASGTTLPLRRTLIAEIQAELFQTLQA